MGRLKRGFGDQFPPADRPVHSMAVKVREDAFGWSLFLAIVVMLTCWVGMAISLSGIADLPKCKYGVPRCYFFVQVCDDMLELGTGQQSCVWMPKQRKTEGATEDGLEQVTVPIMASCLGIVPGMVLVVAMIIRNERCLFALIEIGKMFIAFDIILLVVSCMQMDELTWDCRWWGSEHHPDSDKCEGAFEKYVVGTTFIFITEFLLLCGGIAYAEMERKRVSDARTWVGGDSTANDAVPMNTRVSQPVMSQAESWAQIGDIDSLADGRCRRTGE